MKPVVKAVKILHIPQLGHSVAVRLVIRRPCLRDSGAVEVLTVNVDPVLPYHADKIVFSPLVPLFGGKVENVASDDIPVYQKIKMIPVKLRPDSHSLKLKPHRVLQIVGVQEIRHFLKRTGGIKPLVYPPVSGLDSPRFFVGVPEPCGICPDIPDAQLACPLGNVVDYPAFAV